MNNIEDLRQTFQRHEVLASDGAGIAEAVHAGATRLRRRRRLGIAGGLAVVVAAVPMAAVPMAVVALRQGSPPASVGALTPRTATELTVDLLPGPTYVVRGAGATDVAQRLSVRGVNSSGAYAEIDVLDPGAYDPAILSGGEPVTVQGKPARYIGPARLRTGPPLPPVGTGGPAERMTQPVETSVYGGPHPGNESVVWIDQGGVLVVVQSNDHAAALIFAERVRLGPARPVAAPYALSYLPAGLRVVQALRNVWEQGDTQFVLSLDPISSPPLAGGADLFPKRTGAVLINTTVHSDYIKSHTDPLGPPTKVAGYDTWYRDTYVEGDGLHVQPGNSVMIVNAGDCSAQISVRDKAAVPYTELVKMVEGATFKPCGDASGWVDPIP